MSRIIVDNLKVEELLTRRIGNFEGRENIWPSREEAEKRLKEERLRIYLGIDPTGPSLHLGHTIPLLFLKQLLELKLGHTPVLVIGDFTAAIGDPTGKDTTRKPLSDKEIKDNMNNYFDQVHKILPKKSFEVKHNSSWLAKMSLKDFMNIAGNLSVYQLEARSMFRDRKEKGNPLGVHEFLYPVLQGYDSVAMDIDGEVGGNDQTFNMLIGRDLEKKLLNKDKLVFATELLVEEESGRKMSKTEGGLISLSDSPKDMFGKVMKTIPDGEMISKVFKLCTEKPMQWIEDRKRADPYEFKKELAFELVKIYHGEMEAEKATDEWNRIFSRREYPNEMEEVEKRKLIELVGIVMQSSSTSAKMLINQGAVKVNGEVKKEWNFVPSEGDIIQIGPRKFVKIVR